MVGRVFCLLLIILVACAVLITIAELPPYAAEGNPAENYVYERYVNNEVRDIGITNLVTAIVLDYRGYDTFIETTVLFTAVVSVLITLKTSNKKRKDDRL